MKKLLISITIFIFLLSPLIVWGAESNYGLKETADAAKLDQTAPGELPALIGKILGTGLSLVGVLFFALMLYGGLTWMLARGNSEQESKALDTITAAIIGIVIVLASYAITNFVFTNINPGGGGSGGGIEQKCVLKKDVVSKSCESQFTEGSCLDDGHSFGPDETIKMCVWDGNACGINSDVLSVYCDKSKTPETCDDPTIAVCKWE